MKERASFPLFDSVAGGIPEDTIGNTAYPYECKHCAPACDGCERWSQFDPVRGSLRNTGMLSDRQQMTRNLELAQEQIRPAARNTDPETSKAAARRLNASSLMGRVHHALTMHGPLADFQLAAVLGVAEGSARKRRADLKSIGRVADSGRRIVGPSDREVIVWRAT